jgi:hypothetical protein
MHNGRWARKAHEALTAALQRPHMMPSEPFDRSRLALWLCRCGTYGVWNAPANTVCRTCGAARVD